MERVALTTPPFILKAKKAIKKAFQAQIDKKGFSLVEVLSNCPTNWRMDPMESVNYISNTVIKHFPLGVIKDKL